MPGSECGPDTLSVGIGGHGLGRDPWGPVGWLLLEVGVSLAVGHPVPSPSAWSPSEDPREPQREVWWGGSFQWGEGRGGNPAAAWGPQGPGSLAARLRADSPATGSPKTPAGMGGDTVPGEGLCPLPPGLLSVRSPWPQDAPGSGWGAWPLSSSAARPAATGLGRRACLMAWMGDGFQGEISSSVESLLFAAAHKMSSRRPARRAALQSHLNLLPFPP